MVSCSPSTRNWNENICLHWWSKTWTPMSLLLLLVATTNSFFPLFLVYCSPSTGNFCSLDTNLKWKFVFHDPETWTIRRSLTKRLAQNSVIAIIPWHELEELKCWEVRMFFILTIEINHSLPFQHETYLIKTNSWRCRVVFEILFVRCVILPGPLEMKNVRGFFPQW